MTSRLNFNTGSIVDPTSALQTVLAGIGKQFDAYQEREQNREDRLAREAEDRRRYETQLGRYDRQEQESLRRYEEGKELNRLEREEARRRYDIQEARQVAADKRAEEDQKRQNWLFGKQQEEYGQKEKARAYSMDDTNAGRVAEAYTYNTPAFENLSQGVAHLGTIRNDLVSKAEAARAAGDVGTASRLETQAGKVQEEQNVLAGKATELGRAAVKDVDTNTLTRMIMLDARDKGIQLTEDQAKSAALGMGTDYSTINKTRGENLKDSLSIINAVKRLPVNLVGSGDGEGTAPTKGERTAPLVAVTKNKEGKQVVTSAVGIPEGYDKDSWFGSTEWDNAKEGVDRLLQSTYDSDKENFDTKAATQAAKLALVAGRSGSGKKWDEATAAVAFNAFYDQARGMGKGLEGKEDSLMADVLGRVTRLATPVSESQMQYSRLQEATKAYENARNRVSGYAGEKTTSQTAESVPAVLETVTPPPVRSTENIDQLPIQDLGKKAVDLGLNPTWVKNTVEQGDLDRLAEAVEQKTTSRIASTLLGTGGGLYNAAKDLAARFGITIDVAANMLANNATYNQASRDVSPFLLDMQKNAVKGMDLANTRVLGVPPEKLQEYRDRYKRLPQ